MAVKEITFPKVYRMNELTGDSYSKALNTAVKFFEGANEQPAETVWEVIRWAEQEDLLFYENGDIIGGGE